jgi:hypothetical protein
MRPISYLLCQAIRVAAELRTSAFVLETDGLEAGVEAEVGSEGHT